MTADRRAVPVNEMTDEHLINCIQMLRRSVAKQRLLTGTLSLNMLIVQYLEAEADDRGLKLGYPDY